ncbi:MAG: single-stranded DNA-binding protein [Acidobacteria bacterium]|nr:single-stranded DNA-binding protein [Acidobacteriota bacterium]
MTDRFVEDGKLEREPLIAELRRYLDTVLGQMRLEVKYDLRENAAGNSEGEPEIFVELAGRDQDLLLQHNAELLNAIEYIAHRWLRLPPQFHDQVRLDCAGYRATRLEELRLSARVAAERVRETGQAFRFNPMTSRERRIVHLAIKDVAGVRTSSDGVGERRQVVIYPAEKTS